MYSTLLRQTAALQPQVLVAVCDGHGTSGLPIQPVHQTGLGRMRK